MKFNIYASLFLISNTVQAAFGMFPDPFAPVAGHAKHPPQVPTTSPKVVPEHHAQPASTHFDPPSPLKYCGGDPDFFQLNHIKIEPYPLKAGAKVKVSVSGVLKRVLVAGAYFTVKANLGPIPLFTRTIDFCQEYAKYACPYKEGPVELLVEKNVNKNIPTATISLKIDIHDAQGKLVSCFTGKIKTERK